MPAVHAVARDLARRGRVVITQRGDVRDPDGEIRGPYRLRLP